MNFIYYKGLIFPIIMTALLPSNQLGRKGLSIEDTHAHCVAWGYVFLPRNHKFT